MTARDDTKPITEEDMKRMMRSVNEQRLEKPRIDAAAEFKKRHTHVGTRAADVVFIEALANIYAEQMVMAERIQEANRRIDYLVTLQTRI